MERKTRAPTVSPGVPSGNGTTLSRTVGETGRKKAVSPPRPSARAQGLLDGAEAAAVGLGVVDAGLHDGGGQHVGAVQAGDVLVRDAVGGAQVVELGDGVRRSG
ncbi:hypothetical protein [Streptomyces sp. NPDC051677]|uniref:hypothetical protein n=1 Tax=Streptomyces sp. NPDC051677 TaxID=3365669 RepID=UPI0037CE37CD